jgi:energy-coupling factor transporter ATP-binding protein EcfA2
MVEEADRNPVRLTSIHFSQFKAFSNHTLAVDHMNVLVGPNNSGKSTIIGAVRALAAGLRVARSRSPERLDLREGRRAGYRLGESTLPISLENVHTEYRDVDSEVTFVLSNRNKLRLVFPSEGGCFLIPEAVGELITSTAKFKKHFPIALSVVPILGPVEHREHQRERDTVVAWLSTHRASRHFRSYWRYFPDNFDAFARLVKETWPGMEILRPEIADVMTGELSMFCLENRMTRELYWAGSGFQIWCQMLTHLCRAEASACVVIDEPEVYLHPDVQRQLVGILRNLGSDVIVATHSTEIMAEAEPGDIILVDKQKRTSERLKDVAGVQRAMESVGSIQNITLTALARNRRVLFVEGDGDFRLLRKFARRLGYDELAAGFGVTPLESGGFGSWQRVTTLADGIGQALGTALQIGAVYDRDYYCPEEIDAVKNALSRHLKIPHVHDRKEIENYLLIPAALDRAIERAVVDRRRRGGVVPDVVFNALSLLREITDPMRDEVQSQLIARRTTYLRSSGRDVADLTRETLSRFTPQWDDIHNRLEIVPGKEVLRLFRERVQTTVGVAITDSRIVESIHKHEIPIDLQSLIQSIENFRRADANG